MTRAAALENHVPDAEKERRSAAILALGERLAQDFAQSHVGRDISVLVERRRTKCGKLTGHTGNYIETEFDGPSNLAGTIVTVKASEALDGRLFGRLLTNNQQLTTNNQTGDC